MSGLLHVPNRNEALKRTIFQGWALHEPSFKPMLKQLGLKALTWKLLERVGRGQVWPGRVGGGGSPGLQLCHQAAADAVMSFQTHGKHTLSMCCNNARWGI